MSRQPYGPSPAEREELALLLPVPADRDLPAGRRPVLKEYLVNEIEQTTHAPAPRRRRRLTAIAVPVAVAAAVGTGFAMLGGTDAKPVQAAGGSSTRIVNAGYTLEKQHGGWVKVTVNVRPGVQFDQDTVRADFERMGIASSGIFVGDPRCTDPRASEHQGSSTRILNTVAHPDSTGETGTMAWDIKPGAIPAGYYLEIVLGHAGAATDPVNVTVDAPRGTPPPCAQ